MVAYFQPRSSSHPSPAICPPRRSRCVLRPYQPTRADWSSPQHPFCSDPVTSSVIAHPTHISTCLSFPSLFSPPTTTMSLARSALSLASRASSSSSAATKVGHVSRRAFASSAARAQAEPVQKQPFVKEFRIYRWVRLSSFPSFNWTYKLIGTFLMRCMLFLGLRWVVLGGRAGPGEPVEEA